MLPTVQVHWLWRIEKPSQPPRPPPRVRLRFGLVGDFKKAS